jgi:hypothetical protein
VVIRRLLAVERATRVADLCSPAIEGAALAREQVARIVRYC